MRGAWTYRAGRRKNGQTVYVLYYLADAKGADEEANRVYFRKGGNIGWCESEYWADHYARLFNSMRT